MEARAAVECTAERASDESMPSAAHASHAGSEVPLGADGGSSLSSALVDLPVSLCNVEAAAPSTSVESAPDTHAREEEWVRVNVNVNVNVQHQKATNPLRGHSRWENFDGRRAYTHVRWGRGKTVHSGKRVTAMYGGRKIVNSKL